ncbi:hypothetical protein [Ekhidna sp.]
MKVAQPLLLVFALAALSPTFSQSAKEVAIDSAVRAILLSDIHGYKGKYSFAKQYWDQFDSGIVHTAWQLYERKKERNVALTTLSRNDVILYAEVYQWEYNVDWDGEDMQQLLDYTTLAIRNRGGLDSSMNFSHLSKLPNQFTFGYGCGAAGSIPEAGARMLEFVEADDLQMLDSWLYSVNPTLRAYAYLGFRLLKARGKTLDSTTLERMDRIAHSSIEIYSCSGCTQWGYRPIYEVLDGDNVRWFLERYE